MAEQKLTITDAASPTGGKKDTKRIEPPVSPSAYQGPLMGLTPPKR